ncbi:MAG: AgmX/PglI C-terminal domain-containing protein [Persicimonas sp.]
MEEQHHSLRVAIVWNGTVFQEQTFTQTSEPIVTLGDDEENAFPIPAPGLPQHFEMFERLDNGYTVRFTNKIDGTLSIGGEEWDLDELIDENRAERVDSVPTSEGSADVYELSLYIDDWGMIRLGNVNVFFQLVEQKEKIAGRGLGGIFEPAVAGLVLLAAVLHIGFLISIMLAWDPNTELEEQQIPDRFVDFGVEDVEDPLEEEEDEEEEDTTAKKAGGEEGKFGDEEEDREDSDVPDVDAEKDKEVDVENLGVNKALASDALGDGPLEDVFKNQDGFDSKANVAMAGEGNELNVGRGQGGMGMKGTGGGGGGEGFGRVHGLGDVDTGGGKGTGAKIGKKKAKKVKPKVDRGTPKLGDFCDKRDIANTVNSKQNSIQYCYEKELQQNPELKGKIVANWKVNLDGTVKDVSTAESTINNKAVESCVNRVIKRMRFEKPDGGICVINYPFVFSGIQ